MEGGITSAGKTPTKRFRHMLAGGNNVGISIQLSLQLGSLRLGKVM
jgi:hypothetical protein